MRLGSLFSGIGGLELGLERALGAEVVWQVEIDPYATKVLAKHWPNTRRHEDVRQVGRDSLESVDIICGGFPCQGVSNAGKRKGLKDERSGLWEEYSRIIGELEPRWVVIENVPGLSSRGLDRVLWSLASLGYDAVWDRLSAAAVGAPHIRDRLFIVAYANSAKLWEQPRWSSRQDGKDSLLPADNGEKGPLADTYGEEVPSLGSAFSRYGSSGEDWATESNLDRVADGVPKRMDRIRCLGNGVVPQCSYVIGMWLLEIKKWLEES